MWNWWKISELQGFAHWISLCNTVAHLIYHKFCNSMQNWQVPAVLDLAFFVQSRVAIVWQIVTGSEKRDHKSGIELTAQSIYRMMMKHFKTKTVMISHHLTVVWAFYQDYCTKVIIEKFQFKVCNDFDRLPLQRLLYVNKILLPAISNSIVKYSGSLALFRH
jgi:hypothetical protein